VEGFKTLHSLLSILLLQLLTSVLIDYFRKTKKERTFFVELCNNYDRLHVSVITQFEIYVGSTPAQKAFWDEVFSHLLVLPLTSEVIQRAIEIQQQLKKISKVVDFPDLLIAATAQFHDFPLATLNVKHFRVVSDLKLITK
jgi:predicted nucleic acid-binding protein